MKFAPARPESAREVRYLSAREIAYHQRRARRLRANYIASLFARLSGKITTVLHQLKTTANARWQKSIEKPRASEVSQR